MQEPTPQRETDIPPEQEQGMRFSLLPTILGAVIVLAVIGGGIYLWRSRTTLLGQTKTRLTITTPAPSPQNSPRIQARLNQGQNGPTSATPTPLSTGKGGGQQLPQTGLPLAVVVASLLLIGAGWKLRSLARHQ